MKANLNFNLSEPDDAADFRLHTQARDLYFAVGDILSMLRSMDKYEEFPAGSGLIIKNNLTDKEKEAQDAEQAYLEKLAQEREEYETRLAEYEAAGGTTPPPKPYVPYRYRIFNSNGECMISGNSMIGIIRDLIYEQLQSSKVDLDILP